MNIVDIVIILLILMGAVVGFKQGGIKRAVSFVGMILVFALSWMFKDKLATILYENLPFIGLGNSFIGIEALNILFYKLIAFIILFLLLSVIYRLLLKITGFIEKLLKATIILSIPSKILGIFVGAIEAYFYIFLVLLFLNLPFFNLSIIKESKLSNYILKDTVILSNVGKKVVNTYDNVYDLVHTKNNKSSEEVNEDIVEIFLDNNSITVESIEKLIEKGKIKFNNNSFLNKYR